MGSDLKKTTIITGFESWQMGSPVKEGKWPLETGRNKKVDSTLKSPEKKCSPANIRFLLSEVHFEILIQRSERQQYLLSF